MNRFKMLHTPYRFNHRLGWLITLVALALGVALLAQAPQPATNVHIVARPVTPTIALLNPSSGAVGSSVTITGNGFNAQQGSGTVTFNGITAAVSAWSALSITVTVPATATTGLVVVTANSVSSVGSTFTVTGTVTATACSDAATAGTARYLRSGASGSNNGTDWTNAWTSLATVNTNVTRGQTVCVAGGTYPSQTLTKAASGSSVIALVHAMTTDHGTSTGWSDSFATQATFTDRMTFNTGFWTFNGQVGDYGLLGIGSYGFKFDYSEGGAGFNINGQDHITMKYIDCDGIPTTGDHNYGSQAKCGELYNGTTNLTISHVAMHGCESCLQGSGTNFLVEYCYIYNSRSTSASFHNNGWFISAASGGTIRYNHLFDFNDEGFFFTTSDGPISNVAMYGNTCEEFSGNTTTPRCVEVRQDANYSTILVYNNTAVNIAEGFVQRAAESGTGTHCAGCQFINNLSANASNTLEVDSGATYANNTDDANTSRFVNLGTRFGGSYDLHITGAIAGQSLSSPYNIDILGNTRGADGTWDRGAYEFCSGGCTFALLRLFMPIMDRRGY